MSFLVDDESVVHNKDAVVGACAEMSPHRPPRGPANVKSTRLVGEAALLSSSSLRQNHVTQVNIKGQYPKLILCVCCLWEHFEQLKIHLATEKNVWGTFTGCSHSPLINEDQWGVLLLLNKCNVRKSILFYLFQFNWILYLGISWESSTSSMCEMCNKNMHSLCFSMPLYHLLPQEQSYCN